ncbi:FAD-dependent oxidoreductase, partial [Pectobacterium brasiliense]|nr:FAD-dependent oxidoreductase [Pectobacterium brasiliense]
RVFAVATFATLTEPLNAEQLARMGDMPDWGLTPVNALASATLRYTRDHRFLIREHVKFAPELVNSAVESGRHARRHASIFALMFPQLSYVKLANTWSGLISVTRNGAHIWGHLSDNLYASA